jgi:AraC family transcriptional regulator
LEVLSSEESKSIYISRINRVIDYIKSNLEGDLSLENLSSIANFSKFYFHRIFKSVTGENLNSCVGRMKIEKSAFMLIYNPSLSITSIAFDSGFSSPAVYSREFKAHFKLSPSQWRLEKKSKICKVDRNICKEPQETEIYIEFSKHKPNWGITMQNQNTLNIQVRSIPEMPIAYIRHHGAYNPLDKKLFQSLFSKLISWAAPRDLFNPPLTKAMTIFSSGHPETTAPDHLSVDVAISIEKEVAVEGEVGKRVIPGGQYAVISIIEATMEECGEAWNTLFNIWLPNSGYQPGEGAYYINHLNDPEQHPKKLNTVEMYLPVKPL